MSEHASPQPESLTVVMPVYNEGKTLEMIVERVLSAPVEIPLELICVNDGSTDESLSLMEKLAAKDRRVRVDSLPSNSGKGVAVRRGIELATGTVILIQDGDLEYDPVEYPNLLAPILDGRAQAVFGSRYASSPERRVLQFWHSLANQMLTLISNMVNDQYLTDMETCYKVIRADLFKRLNLKSERFNIEPEIATRLSQAKVTVFEVPIGYSGRNYAEGKKIGLADAFECLSTLFRCRFVDTQAFK